MSFIGRAIVVMFVAILIPAGSGSATASDAWSGTYRMEGVNPDGSDYAGRVRIEPQGDGYLIEWLVAGHRYAGQGIAGRDSLAAGSPEWVVIYMKADDGSLVGAWLPIGSFAAGYERLVPVSGQ